MDDADEEVAFAQRGLVRGRPRDLPRHAGERGGEVIFLSVAPGNWMRKRALGLGLPELLEDFLAQHLLGNAHADLRDAAASLPSST